jgi:hypothetical protein
LSDEPKIVDDTVDHLISQVFPESKKALYKVEMFCESKRSIWKPFAGIIAVWKSGAALSGSGDEKVYFCPRCHAVIMPESHGEYDPQTKQNVPISLRKHGSTFYGASCHECGTIYPGEALEDSRFAKLSVNEWVDLLIRYYQFLRGDVDFYLKYCKTDVRPTYVYFKENEQYAHARDNMFKQMVDKDLIIYPLTRLVEDLHSGRSLKSALRAFLTS